MKNPDNSKETKNGKWQLENWHIKSDFSYVGKQQVKE